MGSSAPAVPKPSEAKDAARDGEHIAQGSSSPFGSSYEGFILQTGLALYSTVLCIAPICKLSPLHNVLKALYVLHTAAAKAEAKTPEVPKPSEAKDAVENGEHGAWSV